MGKQFDLETQSWTDVIDIHEPDDVLPDIDAHGYLIGVYRGQIKPNGSRLRAAMAALPFERPKLAVIANVREEDLADRMMKAIEATAKVINGRATQVIEHRQVEAGSTVDKPLDHSGPFAQNSKHRWRRF